MLSLAKTLEDVLKKVCFVAPSPTGGVYELLTGQEPTDLKGPDIHVLILVQGLKEHNWKPCVIVRTDGKTEIEVVDNVEVIRIHRDTYRVEILNILLELLRLWNAMRQARAAIYVHRCCTPGAAGLFCWVAGKKFIYEIASDVLLERKLPNERLKHLVAGSSSTKYILASVGNWLDIKLANIVTVHNHQQLGMLQKNFGKEGVLVNKPVSLSNRKAPIKVNPPIVLWVGEIARVKQPELFLALAEAIPSVRFQMIGGPGQDTRYSDSIKQAAERIPNLDFLGFVPFVQINEYFSLASLLINTSIFEGYPPHAFLQAWMNYTPVASLGDNSDEILSKNHIGIHSITFEQLVDDVRMMLGDETARVRMGVNGRNYVEREHDLSNVIIRYIELFTNLAT